MEAYDQGPMPNYHAQVFHDYLLQGYFCSWTPAGPLILGPGGCLAPTEYFTPHIGFSPPTPFFNPVPPCYGPPPARHNPPGLEVPTRLGTLTVYAPPDQQLPDQGTWIPSPPFHHANGIGYETHVLAYGPQDFPAFQPGYPEIPPQGEVGGYEEGVSMPFYENTLEATQYYGPYQPPSPVFQGQLHSYGQYTGPPFESPQEYSGGAPNTLAPLLDVAPRSRLPEVPYCRVIQLTKRGRPRRPMRWTKPSCAYCYSNGEIREIWESHTLKDEEGFTSCPILQHYVCPRCGTTGKHAHSLRYCPLAKGGSGGADNVPPTAPWGGCKAGRTSTGDKLLVKLEIFPPL